MKTKIFGDKEIKIRKMSKKDLENAKRFQEFINSFVKEDAQISMNKKLSLKEEEKWLQGKIGELKKRKTVFLLAEHGKKIVGTVAIDLSAGRQIHVANFGITVKKDCREIGLGYFLSQEIIKLAKKELKPRPKILRLSVLPTNKPAMALYKKLGFKKVAQIPKQIELKGRLINEIIMLLYL